MQCEQCNADMAGVEDSHSMLIVLQKVDRATGYSYYQCEQGSMVDGHTFQHWHCNKDEMVTGVKTCLNDHHMEELLQPVPVSQVRLHMIVLNAGLACKVCQESLNEQAYRFCITVATPVNYSPDHSVDSVGEWCCTLDHARNNAINTVEGL